MVNEAYGKANSNNIYVFRKLRKCILSHNITSFSSILECATTQEKQWIKENSSKIENLLKQNDWKKGQKYFALFQK